MVVALRSAEVYGYGKSEKFLQEFQRQTGTTVKVATKFAPLPWRFGANSPVKALKVYDPEQFMCRNRKQQCSLVPSVTTVLSAPNEPYHPISLVPVFAGCLLDLID